MANYVILSARNIDVDEINEKVVLFETTKKVYTSIDTLETTGDNQDIQWRSKVSGQIFFLQYSRNDNSKVRNT